MERCDLCGYLDDTHGTVHVGSSPIAIQCPRDHDALIDEAHAHALQAGEGEYWSDSLTQIVADAYYQGASRGVQY